MNFRFPVLALMLGLSACEEEPAYEGAFEIPVAATVLQPDDVDMLFEEPIGFVANANGGRIHMLSLKQGRFLSDDPTSAFLRGNPLATGEARQLGGIAAWAPAPETLHVFVTDKRFGHLVRIPYIIGIQTMKSQGVEVQFPLEADTTVSDWTLADSEGSTLSRARLRDIEVKQGYTTTETWTLVFDGEAWVVEGTRSGRQTERAYFDEPYAAEHRAIGFTVRGQGRVGDRFTFATDNGLEEIDVGGIPLHVRYRTADGWLYVVVQDEEQTKLQRVDPLFGDVLDSVLPEGARPGRLTEEPSTQSLFTGDVSAPILWEIEAGGQVVEHAIPWPVTDVAPLFGDSGRQVYLVPVGSRDLWRFDLDEGKVVDTNPWLIGDQPLTLSSPINGIESLPIPHLYIDRTDDGVRRQGRSVAVALQEGRVVFVEETTGCLMTDGLGPRTLQSNNFTSSDYTTDFDDVSSPPFLEGTDQNERHVVVNPCAGIARSEVWTLRYDANLLAWYVEGSESGVQPELAVEDRRYTSLDGSVSFLIRSGSSPSEDGWTVQFQVDDGWMSVDGDQNDDGLVDVRFRNPGDPVYFHYRVGSRDAGWVPVDDRPFVLVPGQASNQVGRADPQEGDLDLTWE